MNSLITATRSPWQYVERQRETSSMPVHGGILVLDVTYLFYRSAKNILRPVGGGPFFTITHLELHSPTRQSGVALALTPSYCDGSSHFFRSFRCHVSIISLSKSSNSLAIKYDGTHPLVVRSIIHLDIFMTSYVGYFCHMDYIWHPSNHANGSCRLSSLLHGGWNYVLRDLLGASACTDCPKLIFCIV